MNFQKKINCFIGKNGVGKTNILDAIYYVGLTKSFFQTVESNNIKFNENFFRLEASIESEMQLDIVYKFQLNKKKEVWVNEVIEKKLSEYIGKIPIVFINPDDYLLIQGGSEERRRLIDITISQMDNVYLQNLMLYNKHLEQRNSFIKKYVAENKKIDATLMEFYNQKLVETGYAIFESRKFWIEKMSVLFAEYYRQVGASDELTQIKYESSLFQGDFEMLLRGSLHKDLALERTTIGIHRDDLVFELNNEKIKRFGSQGQQKSFIFALKFAQLKLMQTAKKINPFLLIDDIFDKLDAERSKRICDIIKNDAIGQVFISDTSRDRIEKSFANENDLYEIFEIIKND